MRSSKVGRYLLILMGLMIILGGWMALQYTERQLRRIAGEQKEDATAGPTAAARPALSEPRATGPLAGTTGASGPSGPADPDGPTGPPPNESDARKAVPPGAIW